MSQEILQWAQSIQDLAVDRLRSAFPVETDNYTVVLDKVHPFDARKLATDYGAQKRAVINEIDYTAPVQGDIRVIDKKTGQEISKATTPILDLPVMTSRGTFIIDGNDYSISHQLRRKPGVYSRITESGDLESEVLVKGANFKVHLDPASGLFTANIRGKTRPLYSVLKAMDIPDQQMVNMWGKTLYGINSAKYKPHHSQDVAGLFGAKTPAEIKERLAAYDLDFATTQTTLGKFNGGKGLKSLEPQVFLQASKKLLDISREEDEPDERDALKFKAFTPANKIFGLYLDRTAGVVKDGIVKNLRRTTDAAALPNVGYANSAVKKFFGLDLVNVAERANPLAITSATRKVTFLGTGAIDDENKVPLETRNLHPSHAGFLDPVFTPAARAGVNFRLAESVTFNPSQGNFKTKIKDKQGAVTELNPIELYDKVIAFPGQFDEKGKPRHSKVRAVHKGKIGEFDAKDVHGSYATAQGLYSTNTNLVPFMNSNSGNRLAMAAQMVEQSLSLKDPEAPLVDSLLDGEPATQVAARRFLSRAPVSGKVVRVSSDVVTVEGPNGKTHDIPLYNNYPIAGDKYITEKPTVKEGDTVSEGDVVADNNYTKGGRLALGKNLVTAYLPGNGWTFEDGFVLTEQGAKKLTSQHLYRFEIPKEANHRFNLDEALSQAPGKYSAEDLADLEKTGIIKPGTVLTKNRPLALYLREQKNEQLAKIHKKFGALYRPTSVTWDKDFQGEVAEVHETPKKFIVMVKADAPAQVGDKIAGRHGNKGVITRIIPEGQAPRLKDGTPIDWILSPAGIPSRMNEGSLLETAFSKVVKARGMESMPVPAYAFDDAAGEVMKTLKQHNLTDKEPIDDPQYGEIPHVNVGYQYVMKLEQQADKKTNVRSNGAYDVDDQPTGGDGGGQTVNRLFFNAMLAHGARENLAEMTNIKGTKRDEYWRALKMGMPVAAPTTQPFVMTKFYDMLRGVGIDPKRKGDQVFLLPAQAEDVLKRSNGEIKTGKFIRGKDDEPISGGLFDPAVTGGPEGKNWAHVKLAREIPNPVFEGAVKSLLDMTQSQFDQTMSNKYFYDPKARIWLDKKAPNLLTGAAALKKALSDIPVKDEIQAALDLSQRVDNPTQLNKISKKVRYLKTLQDHNLKTDVYFTDVVPVVPPALRPLYQREGALIQSPLNRLYSNLIVYNNKFKDIKYDSKELQGRVYSSMYDLVKSLYGLTDTTIQGRPFKGVVDMLAGDTPKRGFYQNKVVRKRQDTSARTVITLNTALGPDEVGLPEHTAWELYRPYVMRRMAQNGFSPLDARKKIDEHDSAARAFLQQEVDARPVMISRDPVLHKYGVMGMRPVIIPGIKSMQINPFVTSSLNADFDGDSAINSVFSRSVNLTFNPGYGTMGAEVIPMLDPAERIRSTEGLTNLRDFPRIESSRVDRGHISEFDVPPGTEVLVSKDGVTQWAAVEKFSIHRGVEVVEVTTNTSRTIHPTTDHALITVDEDLNYVKSPPAIGLTIPRLRQPIKPSARESAYVATFRAKRGSVPFSDLPLTTDTGWLTGVHIGDGWTDTTPGCGNRVNLANVSEGVKNNLQRIVDALVPQKNGGGTHIISVDAPHEYKGYASFSRKLTWSSPEFADFFRNEVGHGAANKHLPSFWLHSPLEFRRGLLAGLLDTDGTVSVNTKGKRSKPQTHVAFYTISRALAYEVVALGHTLDLTASVTVTQTPQKGEAYVVSFTQDSILKMQSTIKLYCEEKADALAKFKANDTHARNKYTPRISKGRLRELRGAIGTPQLYKKGTKELLHDFTPKEVAWINARRSLYSIVYQKEKRSEVLIRDTAMAIIDLLGPEFFSASTFWSKWKTMVEDDTIEWELVTSITPCPEITEAYDLTIPPFYTMVTEAGFIVQDTMSIHVPISPAAISEVRNMFPTKMLRSPATGGFTLKPQEDALLGLSLLTEFDPKEKATKSFPSAAEAAKAFSENKERASEPIMVGNTKTTFGRAFVEHSIPGITLPDGRVDKKSLTPILEDLEKKSPDKYGENVHKMTAMGNRFAYVSGFSVGLSDLVDGPKAERDQIFKKALSEVRKLDAARGDRKFMTKPEQRKRAEILFGAVAEVEQLARDHYKDKDNSFFKMVDVGSKGTMGQLAQGLVAPMAFYDVLKRPTPFPIGRSYAEGLDPSDQFISMYGTRKGQVDNKMEVTEPGYMAKQLVNSAQDNVISTADCGTSRGLTFTPADKDAQDRHLAEDVLGFKAGALVTSALRQDMEKAGVKEFKVRSPLFCSAKEGTCQHCFGLSETGKHAPIGTNIGVIAATSMSEPLTQMVMKTKHLSGQVGTGLEGLPRIRQIVQMPEKMPESAAIAQATGKISSIEDAPAGGKYVWIDSDRGEGDGPVQHYIPSGAPEIDTVKVGAPIKAGERLSGGEINPIDHYAATKDIYATRTLLNTQIKDAYALAGQKMRPQIYETMVKSMTNTARIKRSGTPDVIPGTYTTLPAAEAEQKANKTVEFEPVIKGVNILPTLNKDWAARMSFTKIKSTILDSAASGDSTNVHGYHPVSAWIHGTEFGKGTFGRY